MTKREELVKALDEVLDKLKVLMDKPGGGHISITNPTSLLLLLYEIRKELDE